MTTKKVLKSEALSENLSFEYKGDVYVIPPAKDWDLEVIEATEDGKMLGACKKLLGDDQYATLRKVAKTMGDLNDFYEALWKAQEADPKASTD